MDPELKTETASGANILFNSNLNSSHGQAYIDSNYGGKAYYPTMKTFSVGVNVTLE